MQPSPILRVLNYRHLRLTTKDVNKGFYKGNRTGAMGRHTRFGGYQIEWNRVRTYVVPERLRDPEFKLTPFVGKTIHPERGRYETKAGPKDPALYLETWKMQNGKY
ncbi:hypothetical protein SODALDRAFT_335379 [Sodiomyces alkalinus F11]|uniref:50S ribosomal protein YmL27 n=1 Tax=Sodiomyces alkalinus (strain CBS 110278 / VKM F-3762 / F11) TaxID=1314773 RepID=A0A3N2PP62_SODAK|nr:hypothetical protein SODALDRAFT_335379 [Sodiomyces alkalinus F11]ROT36289.1 hypothetical protein SODALDRAFT_335379 [Sodiomyces alkalinus F11]